MALEEKTIPANGNNEAKFAAVKQALAKNGFQVNIFDNAEEAGNAVMDLIPSDSSVGIGGSVTVQQMGLREVLLERGNSVFWHWYSDPSERNEVCRKANTADFYLMSTNAVTKEGELINIDGSGNRTSALLFGPKSVIVICGKNKIVDDYNAAIERIKTIACPMNAKRLNLSTPCAKTGRCSDCSSPMRMCNMTVNLQKAPHGREIHVFIVNEDLGY